MSRFKTIIYVLIALSFVFTGIPVQAKPMPCPMAKMHAEMQMSKAQADMGMSDMKMGIKDCDKCPKSEQQKQAEKTKKNGCCDDAACNAKCAALSSVSTLFPTDGTSFSALTARSDVHPLPYLLPPSLALKTPEKPPKFLS